MLVFFGILVAVSFGLGLVSLFFGMGVERAAVIFSPQGFSNFISCFASGGVDALIIIISFGIVGVLFIVSLCFSLFRKYARFNLIKVGIVTFIVCFELFLYGAAPAPIPGWSGLVLFAGAFVGAFAFLPANTKVGI